MTAGSLREARQQSRSHKIQLNKLICMALILKEQPGKKNPNEYYFTPIQSPCFL